MEELEDLSYTQLIREEQSLIDYINTETSRGGAARTEYRQLDAIQDELEERDIEEE